MTCGIYKITNKINGKCYIGQSKNIERRWKIHKRPSEWKRHKALYAAFEKYGVENFNFEIIVECKPFKLDSLEIEYIKEFDSYNNGYNRTLGGQGCVLDEGEYFKNKLKRIYMADLDDLIEKFKPIYVSTDTFAYCDDFIYTKKEINKRKKEQKKNNNTYDFGVDYVYYDDNNPNHRYMLLSSVNRYLEDNIEELNYYFSFENIFNENEYKEMINQLEINLLLNGEDINFEEVDEHVLQNNDLHSKDSIYDLIPDYDELGGDDYFDGCFW